MRKWIRGLLLFYGMIAVGALVALFLSVFNVSILREMNNYATTDVSFCIYLLILLFVNLFVLSILGSIGEKIK